MPSDHTYRYRAASETALSRARQLVGSFYHRHRALLSQQWPPERFSAMLYEFIPNSADDRAANAGARRLIELLQADANAARAAHQAAVEEHRRRKAALADLLGRLADLEQRALVRENIEAVKAEAAEVRRQLHVLCGKTPAPEPRAGEAANGSADREGLKDRLFELMQERQRAREEALMTVREEHLLKQRLDGIDVKYEKLINDVMAKL